MRAWPFETKNWYNLFLNENQENNIVFTAVFIHIIALLSPTTKKIYQYTVFKTIKQVVF